MVNRTTRVFFGVVVCCGCFSAWAGAQQARPEDATLDAMRGLGTISVSDQRRISEWVQKQVDELVSEMKSLPVAGGVNQVRIARNAGFRNFRARLRAQFGNAGNSTAFTTQFVKQTNQVAVQQFGGAALDDTVAWALCRVLVDMDSLETFEGLLAGLKSKDGKARYTCAKGLTGHQRAIATDKPKLAKLVQAVSVAGVVEASPVVLSQLYRCIAIPGQAADVVGAFMTIFDVRLAFRRGVAVIADGAESDAFDYFRARGVVGALNPAQKAELVRRVAVFLRLDAERYNTGTLDADETMDLEMSMSAAEAVLVASVANQTAGIDAELQRGGHGRRADILAKVYEWVGDPASQQSGVLTAAPWNVPIGAP